MEKIATVNNHDILYGDIESPQGIVVLSTP